MTIASISFPRQPAGPYKFSPSTASGLQRRYLSSSPAINIAARRYNQSLDNVTRKVPHQNMNLLKAREDFKRFSSPASVLCHEDKLNLSQDQAVGTVSASQANFMRVIVQSLPSEVCTISELTEGSGGTPGVVVELLCVVKAVLKKIKRRVMVGDKVLVGSIDWVDRRGMIENVFRRKCEISDPPVANADHLLVLFSLEQPKLEAFSLTRFLIEAESSEIPFTLALNKCELVPEETLAAWRCRLHKWGYEPIFCSAKLMLGIDALQFIMRERTSVIVGPSGVGKSSLINVMRINKCGISGAADGGIGFSHPQSVGEVSTRSGRGKHTTRNISLLPISGGGYIADTPGFNQPSLTKVTKQSLAQSFPEVHFCWNHLYFLTYFEPINGHSITLSSDPKRLEDKEPLKCSFSNCLHLGEPGCVVGGDWERYPYYLRLLDDIRIREEIQLRVIGTKQESDVRYKARDRGVMHAEPRLEPKKHRRQSRKEVNQSVLDKLNELEDDEDTTNGL